MAFGNRDAKSKPPKRTLVSHSSLREWRARGIVSTEGSRIVVRSGGPPEDPWREAHTFEHLDRVTFHTVDGDVRYDVVANPDKWPDSKDGDTGFGGEVRWVYDLKLVAESREPAQAPEPRRKASATA